VAFLPPSCHVGFMDMPYPGLVCNVHANLTKAVDSGHAANDLLLALAQAAGSCACCCFGLLWTTMHPVNTVAIRKACLVVQASMAKLLPCLCCAHSFERRRRCVSCSVGDFLLLKEFSFYSQYSSSIGSPAVKLEVASVGQGIAGFFSIGFGSHAASSSSIGI